MLSIWPKDLADYLIVDFTASENFKGQDPTPQSLTPTIGYRQMRWRKHIDRENSVRCPSTACVYLGRCPFQSRIKTIGLSAVGLVAKFGKL